MKGRLIYTQETSCTNYLVRTNLHTLEAEVVKGGSFTSLHTCGGYLWVVDNRDIWKIDPITSAGSKVVEMNEDFRVLACDEKYIWGVLKTWNRLVRVDVESKGMVYVPLSISPNISSCLVKGYLWIADNASSTLFKIDNTGVCYTIKYDIAPSAPKAELCTDGEFLWLVDGGQLMKIDTETDEIIVKKYISNAGGYSYNNQVIFEPKYKHIWLMHSPRVALRINSEDLEILHSITFDKPIKFVLQDEDHIYIIPRIEVNYLPQRIIVIDKNTNKTNEISTKYEYSECAAYCNGYIWEVLSAENPLLTLVIELKEEYYLYQTFSCRSHTLAKGACYLDPKEGGVEITYITSGLIHLGKENIYTSKKLTQSEVVEILLGDVA